MNKNNNLVRSNSVPSLFRDVDNMFDSLFGSSFFGNPFGSLTEDGTYVKTIDVPGLKETDLQVKVEDSLVTVSGESKTENSYRSVNHSFSIPDNFDTNTLAATLENGVLTIQVKPLPSLPVKEAKVVPVLTAKPDTKS